MDVLFVTGYLPYPPTSGANTRSYHLILRMAKRHRLHLVAYAELPKDVKGLSVFEKWCASVRGVPWRETKGTTQFYFELLLSVLSQTPVIASRFTKPSMAKAIQEVLQKEQINLIHCDFLTLSLNLPAQDGQPIPRLLTAHNVESVLWKRYLTHEKNPLKALYIYLLYLKLMRFERLILRRFQHVVCVSQDNMDRLRMLCPSPVYRVVPNGVDLEYFTPTSALPVPYRLVFTGAMDWRPNQDAMRFFLSQVYPRIKRAEPRANLVIVGRTPPESLKAMSASHKDVTVTGTVQDVRPYLGSAAVFVAPLRIGGGTRLKILEAMAMAKPVVSTRVGCEGLAVAPDKELLVADHPEVFAQAVLRLFDDQALATRIGQAGHELVRNVYGWDQIADDLDEAWREAAMGGHAKPCVESPAC